MPLPNRKQRLPSSVMERVAFARTLADRAEVLVADEDSAHRQALSGFLAELGCSATLMSSDAEVLDALASRSFDALLISLKSAHLDAFGVLRSLRERAILLPVIVVAAPEDMDAAVECIRSGATDVLPWPVNPELLRARLDASLANARLHAVERAYTEQVRADRQRSDDLLGVMLPLAIAERLKRGERDIAEQLDSVTVLFADIVGFTPFAAEAGAREAVRTLNMLFTSFDRLCARHAVEKIKTIGDEYMVAAGMPQPDPDHALVAAALALDMLGALAALNPRLSQPIQIRIGMHSGPVIAGVIGTRKLAYDLWGDTVNTAHRMQSSGVAGSITVSAATRALLEGRCRFVERGTVEVKGKGPMPTYLLTGLL